MIVSFLARFVFILLLAWAAPVAAQDTADMIAPADLESLVQTLEDEPARAQLTQHLKTLLAAQKQQQSPPEDLGLLSDLSKRIDILGEQIAAAAAMIADLPRFLTKIWQNLADPIVRQHLMTVALDLAVVLGAGLIVDYGATRLLRRPLTALEMKNGVPWLARITLILSRIILSVFPIALFAAVGYGAMAALDLKGNVRLAALMLVTGYAIAQAVMAVARGLISPRTGAMRLVPIDDESAHYLIIWIRRVSATAIYGWFLAQSLRLLGLPVNAHTLLLKAVGLVVVTITVIFILQNRQIVAGWIRARGQALGISATMAALRNRLAEIWHILAILYVLAVFSIWALNVKGGFDYVIKASGLTALILVLAGLASAVARKSIDQMFSISDETKKRFPGIEARANRYLPVLRSVIRMVIGLVTALSLLEAWGVHSFGWLSTETGRKLLSATVTIGLVLVVALLVWEFAASAIERYLSRTDDDGKAIVLSSRARTLLPLLRNVLLVLLVILVVLIVLSELGVNIAPLLAGAGVVGLAIGFGSQKLVQDVITGIFILIEDTIAVGDVIKLGEHSGVVEAMSIRSLRLRDVRGQLYTIPFSTVERVVNMTRDFAFHVIELPVSYRQDIGAAMAAILAVGREMQADRAWAEKILEPVEANGIERLEAAGVVIRGRIKTLAGEQWAVGREFNLRLKQAFEEAGIEMPSSHTTFSFADDKMGRAPILRVKLEEGALQP